MTVQAMFLPSISYTLVIPIFFPYNATHNKIKYKFKNQVQPAGVFPGRVHIPNIKKVKMNTTTPHQELLENPDTHERIAETEICLGKLYLNIYTAGQL